MVIGQWKHDTKRLPHIGYVEHVIIGISLIYSHMNEFSIFPFSSQLDSIFFYSVFMETCLWVFSSFYIVFPIKKNRNFPRLKILMKIMSD